MRDAPWEAIFKKYGIHGHDFDKSPFTITAQQIKDATSHFTTTGDREVRILCKQDTRESRPQVFIDRGLFLLPIRNGEYVIVRGEGYLDIPAVTENIGNYHSNLDFRLDTSKVGNSEMQHIDFAYASSLIRTFLNDPSLVLTIRGRKYTPQFSFNVGNNRITAGGVQTEVDAGYEGRNQVVLVEVKGGRATNTIIRQLFYPFRQWQAHTQKQVIPLFFENIGNEYHIWQFEFTSPQDYNSIRLVRSGRFVIDAP